MSSLGELACEICDHHWRLNAVIIGTPHRGHGAHQVLVVDQGNWSYTEELADANDTTVLI